MTPEPDEDDVKALRAMSLQQRLEGALNFTNQVRQFKMA